MLVISQKLLEDGNAKLTQSAFSMATKNEDMVIMKLLVRKGLSMVRDYNNIEHDPRNETDWKEALFGPNNIFLKNVQDLKLINYLKELHEKENIKHALPEWDGSNIEVPTNDELDSSKFLYELQMQDGNLDTNMKFNSSLSLTKTIELMIMNHKAFFDDNEKLMSILEDLFTNKSYSNALFLFKEYPALYQLTDETKLKEQSVNIISGFLKLFPDRCVVQALEEDLVSQLTTSNDQLIKFLSATDLRARTVKPEDINKELDDGNNSCPLHLAAKEDLSKLVEVLLSKGSAVDAKNRRKETALHFAASEGNEEVLRLLLQNNADIDAKNDFESTPLHLASFNGKEKIARALLENNANPNALDQFQDTPLHLAAWEGHPKVVDVLLKHGADKNLRNNENRTPLREARYNRGGDYKAVVGLLEEN